MAKLNLEAITYVTEGRDRWSRNMRVLYSKKKFSSVSAEGDGHLKLGVDEDD